MSKHLYSEVIKSRMLHGKHLLEKSHMTVVWYGGQCYVAQYSAEHLSELLQ